MALAGCCPVAAWAQASRPVATYAEPVAVCQISDPRLNEASGLVASRRNPGYYYTHNDSGGEPHVYVLDRSGRIVVTIRLAGATNTDWEDIALSPGNAPGSFDICVADIGDNKSRRPEIVIYRLAEPELDAATRARGVADATPATIRCRYENGPRNAEGFAVDRSGVGWVFSKRFDGKCDVYRLATPWNPDAVNTLQRAGLLKFPDGTPPLATMVTAADISCDGARLVTRSYVAGWEWQLSGGTSPNALSAACEHLPSALRLAPEQQGEAICFSADGKSLLTISEGSPTTLYESPPADSAAPERP